MKVHVAFEGFENELRTELGSTLKREEGRLFFAEGLTLGDPAWAQTTWLDAEEVEIQSIGDAAKKLRALQPFWAHLSLNHHRRAKLIEEKLPRLKKVEAEFLAPPPQKSIGGWTLLEPNRLLYGTRTTSPYPNGEVIFEGDKRAPSRAYLKLWELFTAYGVRPHEGDKCVDFGACPGGWTWVLAQLGCHVTAIDRSPLDPAVANLKNVTTVLRNAFTLKPDDVGPIDWFFSDIICFPKDLYELVEAWRRSGLCRNFVCSIKFKGETDHETVRKFAAIPGSRLKHLYNNKHEMTWWLVAD